ncbi:MAG TPA: hypothetical protein EYH42_06525 [Sulfurovum sp.]|nr:hypothetical protein [Sulfurovum sp.]
MSYSSWFQEHGEKHKAIMAKLTHLSPDEVIRYFRFDNMVKNEPDFCPLYKDNKKCHDMKALNCYLCACPNFRFKDEGFNTRKGKTLYSACSISSKEGGQFISEDAIHQDCSKCAVPHHESYIKRQFTRDWFEMMEDVSHS